ncbi:MAG: acylphosphatase [Deltaproteobacteria bacterium]|nr:acylphosphatase [Deltaproteobacteria bacterium]
MDKKRLHLQVYGRVQGVFFRGSTRDEARRLMLRGWVRNVADGSVEVLAEGDEEDLGQLLSWCRRGPPAADVTRLESTWQPWQGTLEPFSVCY